MSRGAGRLLAALSGAGLFLAGMATATSLGRAVDGVQAAPVELPAFDEAVRAEAEAEQRIVGVLKPDDQRRLNALLRKLVLAFQHRDA